MNNDQLMYLGGYVAGMITWMIIAVIVAVVAYYRSKPRKPYYKKPVDEYDDGHWICPRCGAGVGYYDIEDKYCSECGQKIDWRKRNG